MKAYMYVVGTHQKHLTEALVMCTHNIFVIFLGIFHGDIHIRKIDQKISTFIINEKSISSRDKDRLMETDSMPVYDISKLMK